MNTELKVFAEFIEENNIQYRTKTILKYGDSWDLIGTIAMKNPGSAYPWYNIDLDDFNKIKKHFYPAVEIENWHVFKEDSTIKRILKLFDGSFIGKPTILNGVILIYNLFNVREAKIVEAVKKANMSDSEYLLPNIDELIASAQNKPIYLGFNWEYKNTTNKHQQKIEKFATDLFDHVKHSENMYCINDMINNYFYHPLSPQILNPKYQPILNNFYEKIFK